MPGLVRIWPASKQAHPSRLHTRYYSVLTGACPACKMEAEPPNAPLNGDRPRRFPLITAIGI